MKFKPGDRVKFLDQVGEGVVKAILPNGKLMIEDENLVLTQNPMLPEVLRV